MRLPKTPSILIFMAIEDVKWIEKSKQYTIQMNEWHTPELLSIRGGKVCEVCLAGSVMVRRFPRKNDHKLCRTPGQFGDHNNNIFRALNLLRTGNITGFVNSLDYHYEYTVLCKDSKIYDVVIPKYGNDPKGFKQSLLKLAAKFKAIGL